MSDLMTPAKFRIVTLSGRGLPTTVEADGYDTELAAEQMADAEHDGKYRIEAYVTLPAKAYEDHDNCLAAAAADVADGLSLEAWQVEAHWDNEQQRNAIIVMVPSR